MTALTWLAVAVLGVGSIAVFLFFLRDVPRVLPRAPEDAEGGDANSDRPPD